MSYVLKLHLRTIKPVAYNEGDSTSFGKTIYGLIFNEKFKYSIVQNSNQVNGDINITLSKKRDFGF